MRELAYMVLVTGSYDVLSISQKAQESISMTQSKFIGSESRKPMITPLI